MAKEKPKIDNLGMAIKGVAKSVDDLATMMKEGFEKVDKKFDEAKKERDKLLAKQLTMEEQLNNCATKDELKATKSEILDAVDYITKKYDAHDMEHVANLDAHYRMQDDINEVREHVGLKIKNPAIPPKFA